MRSKILLILFFFSSILQAEKLQEELFEEWKSLFDKIINPIELNERCSLNELENFKIAMITMHNPTQIGKNYTVDLKHYSLQQNTKKILETYNNDYLTIYKKIITHENFLPDTLKNFLESLRKDFLNCIEIQIPVLKSWENSYFKLIDTIVFAEKPTTDLEKKYIKEYLDALHNNGKYSLMNIHGDIIKSLEEYRENFIKNSSLLSLSDKNKFIQILKKRFDTAFKHVFFYDKEDVSFLINSDLLSNDKVLILNNNEVCQGYHIISVADYKTQLPTCFIKNTEELKNKSIIINGEKCYFDYFSPNQDMVSLTQKACKLGVPIIAITITTKRDGIFEPYELELSAPTFNNYALNEKWVDSFKKTYGYHNNTVFGGQIRDDINTPMNGSSYHLKLFIEANLNFFKDKTIIIVEDLRHEIRNFHHALTALGIKGIFVEYTGFSDENCSKNKDKFFKNVLDTNLDTFKQEQITKNSNKINNRKKTGFTFIESYNLFTCLIHAFKEKFNFSSERNAEIALAYLTKIQFTKQSFSTDELHNKLIEKYFNSNDVFQFSQNEIDLVKNLQNQINEKRKNIKFWNTDKNLKELRDKLHNLLDLHIDDKIFKNYYLSDFKNHDIVHSFHEDSELILAFTRYEKFLYRKLHILSKDLKQKIYNEFVLKYAQIMTFFLLQAPLEFLEKEKNNTTNSDEIYYIEAEKSVFLTNFLYKIFPMISLKYDPNKQDEFTDEVYNYFMAQYKIIMPLEDLLKYLNFQTTEQSFLDKNNTADLICTDL